MDDERRRNMDIDYVTRREWNMHVSSSNSRDRRIEQHMNRQDEAIDKLDSNLSRMFGGIAVLVIVGNIIVTVILQ
jgi:hypothetical protein